MQKNLESNVWKYTLVLITNKRIFVAILGAYYLTIPGVTPQVIGTVLLISTLAGFLFEIPSGYISDKFGHKQTLVLSRILMILSTFFLLISENFWGLVMGGVFMSLAQSFFSGTGSAFMHETLQALKKENEYSRIMGKASSIGFAVPIVLIVLVPFLVSYSYKLPFIISLVVDIIGLLAVLSLMKPPVPEGHVEEVGITNFKQVMQEGYRIGFFPLAFFSGIISGVLFGVSAFRAPYQSFLEVPVIWFGVLFGIGRALASLMLAYSGETKRYFTLISFYRFQLILYVLLICLLGLVSNPWVVAVLFILSNAFTWGLSKIDEGFHLEVIKKSKFKATLLSTTSQIYQAIAAISSFGLGFLIEHFSYESGFLAMGITFFVTLFPLYLYITHKYKVGSYMRKTFSGVVERGKGWGHKIGYPTANIPCLSSSLSGTYAGHVVISSDRIERAAAVYVDTKRKLLESHILDFTGDLYGQEITVTLLEKVAEAKKFKDETALQEFIGKTVTEVKIFFKDKE